MKLLIREIRKSFSFCRKRIFFHGSSNLQLEFEWDGPELGGQFQNAEHLCCSCMAQNRTSSQQALVIAEATSKVKP